MSAAFAALAIAAIAIALVAALVALDHRPPRFDGFIRRGS